LLLKKLKGSASIIDVSSESNIPDPPSRNKLLNQTFGQFAVPMFRINTPVNARLKHRKLVNVENSL
jgi:hypothetical protein